MYTQLKLIIYLCVCTNKNTLTIVCIHNYIYSNKCMFTKYKRLGKNIKIFINEIYSKPPKRNYSTNKTDVCHIDDVCSLDILDLKDHGPENNRG